MHRNLKTIAVFVKVQLLFYLLLTSCTSQITSQEIIREAKDGKSYPMLTELCKEVGPRLSGSKNAEKAVIWGKETLEELGFDTVYLQEVMVPHWERGEKEFAFWTNQEKELQVTALGGSVGSNGLIEAEIVEVQGFKELEELGKAGVEGKIVFYNRPMDSRLRNTFRAYGMAVNQRADGAWQAARFGAKAVIVRSMTGAMDFNPHTGTMNYVDSLPKIPAFAVSTNDAQALSEGLKSGPQKLQLKSNCQWFPDALSHNVIGEIKGIGPKIITVGGHLDSWDLGEGAHDDGAGIVHSIEALRILKDLGYKPQNTLRVVLFMNEENGAMGGKEYALQCSEKGEQHLMAIESDRGGFYPEAFSIDGSDETIEALNGWLAALNETGITEIYKGYGGVDISFLKESYPDITLVGLVPNPENYFKYHHTAEDVLENVNKPELEAGSAALANLIYLVDSKGILKK